jgi:hypothetical protein
VCGVGEGLRNGFGPTPDAEARARQHRRRDALAGSQRETHFAADEVQRAAGLDGESVRELPYPCELVGSHAARQDRQLRRWGVRGAFRDVSLRAVVAQSRASDLKGRRTTRGDCRESEAVANYARPSYARAPG